ncbi:MAG: winged helix-turn-helix transcriptional regulator [Chloroflexi bacterium]|nr:winged helix-turn-helix transcriptional regulator [Chloroflexota bacterium]
MLTTQQQVLLLPRLKALADATRLEIIALLRNGTRCNGEIAPILGLSLSLVSHHMRILREAGLITSARDDKDARWIYYSLDEHSYSELRSELDAIMSGTPKQPEVSGS